jgi:pyruvate ferredoxin oxidoreductase gamma subunit/2-oxoisovalerate ferredoxin oxidoreductase gamma subunit
MLEFRMHARGGQGVVLLSKLIATAFFLEGNYVQTFPTFGAERRGSPVAAFLRVDKDIIWQRCNLLNPNHVIILEANLLDELDVLDGLQAGGHVVLNSPRAVKYDRYSDYKLSIVDCSQIAMEFGLGSPPSLIVNTVMFGVFAKITGMYNIESVEAGIRKWIPSKTDQNIAAARAGFITASTIKDR